jgi:hypothetical protein
MTLRSRLVLGLALFAMLTTTVRSAEPEKLLPATTDTVLQVNVRQILDSEIIKKYAIGQIKQALEGQEAKKLLTEIGLDPLKDIEKIVVGTSGANKSELKYLMVVHGKFDPDKLYKTAEAQSKKDADKFSMIKDGNTVMFKYQPENGDPPVYGTVVDEKTVIAASDKKLISSALAAATGGQTSQLKAEIADLVKKMDDKSSIYAVSILKGKLNEVQLPAGGQLPVDLSSIQKLLPKTENATIAVKIGADINMEVNLGMKDDESAGEMRNALDELLKQIKPLAQLAAAAEPRAKPLGEILGTIKTSVKSKDVVISGKVTGTNIGKMVNPNNE